MKANTEKTIKVHLHDWRFLKTGYDYPRGLSDTSMAQEFAYFSCDECKETEKRQVTMQYTYKPVTKTISQPNSTGGVE